jgi:2,3-bisphosphoglycerate-independent phosphoglycerate mutase
MNRMFTTNQRPKPVVLCILDGWGHRLEKENNAIAQATTPTWDRLVATCPHALVETSGLDVGLPDGQMGNSEVGHMNIGGGRVMVQDLPRIDAAVADGSLMTNSVLMDHIDRLKKSGGKCHLLGLISRGGVHSHQDQISALAHIIDGAGVPVRIHAFLDGRDSPPKSAARFIENFATGLLGLNNTEIATVGGRYYGMDRDNRWERVERAYRAIVDADGEKFPSAPKAISASYVGGVTDEFMVPAVVGEYHGMSEGDGILMANFRADRVRQILCALLDPMFGGFTRSRVVSLSTATGLSKYSSDLSEFMTVMFPGEAATNTLGAVISAAGLKQLRIAETEKYAHVTFFLNGGAEKEFPKEARILVPSPKVATYDLKPEMAAAEVTDQIAAAISQDQFDVIVVNFANGDMVGHTGVLTAAIKAAEALDACLARLEKALMQSGGTMVITADHGNLEMMRDPSTDEPHTQHTVGKVPLILVNPPDGVERLNDGRLADLAPTVLDLLNISKPGEMTGHSLLHRTTSKHTTSNNVNRRAPS